MSEGQKAEGRRVWYVPYDEGRGAAIQEPRWEAVYVQTSSLPNFFTIPKP